MKTLPIPVSKTDLIRIAKYLDDQGRHRTGHTHGGTQPAIPFNQINISIYA